MNNNNNYVIIMAGGIGTRFWPFSRKNLPKQFQDILGTGETLIQGTVRRFEGVCPIENIFVVTNENYYDLVKEQIPQLNDEQILLEPMMRNTAACIAYATYKIAKKNPDANMVVTPADHIITKEAIFKDNILTILNETAQKDILVTLGIQPSRPDTGYGYIHFAEKEDTEVLHQVKTFTEKPDFQFAVTFVQSGEFLWNAGIFVWNAPTIIKQFQKHLPVMHSSFTEIKDDFYTEKEKESIYNTYLKCKKTSIDYGIMEKADNVFVLKTEVGWSDLGTWNSLYQESKKDKRLNVITENTILKDTKKCIVKIPKGRLAYIKGLEDYIIAEYDNVLMIYPKDEEQDIRSIVAEVEKEKGEEYV